VSEPAIQLESLTQCIAQLASGELAAREHLIEHATTRLVLLVRRNLRSFPSVGRWEQTNDVMQGVLMRLYRALETCRPADTREFFALAGELIRRELIDLKRHHFGPQCHGAHYSTQNRGSQDTRPPEIEPAPRASDDPAEIVLALEIHEQVSRLPQELLEVFNLLWYQGLSHEQAAELLKTSTKTIQRRWRDARIELSRLLEATQ
jgi:RNA polymerase sigma-70 factor (ECF subfamily)